MKIGMNSQFSLNVSVLACIMKTDYFVVSKKEKHVYNSF